MTKTLHKDRQAQMQWFAQPDNNHIVQFYQYDDALMLALEEYVATGLSRGDTCILIATAKHLAKLEARLQARDFDIDASRQAGQYITLSASETLDSLMVNGLPDRQRYMEVVGTLAEQAQSRGKPIRAFGEMVALLWKDSNPEAVIQLEELWNELAQQYRFSLYCGYPQLYFDMAVHGRHHAKITSCHAKVAAT